MRVATSFWSSVLVCAACSYQPLPALPDDAASAVVKITAVPEALDLHVGDSRDIRLTVENVSTQPDGPFALDIVGLMTGAGLVASSSCTTELAPGATCTATVNITGSSEGQGSFQVRVMTGPTELASAPVSINVRPACPRTCGPQQDANCCLSPVVPGNATGAGLSGEPFYRSYDVATDGMWSSLSAPATVSDFRLDRYEVTVARFRSFVEAGFGTQAMQPASGSGAHARIPGSGWNASWAQHLPLTTAELSSLLQCNPSLATWSPSPTLFDNRPINCVSWYLAAAFCIWDGGYLPTEAEWNYAAAGGSQQRAYPWSDPADSLTVDCTHANYLPVAGGQPCNSTGTAAVGSRSPQGDGRWEHSDLGGNVWEWVLDVHSTVYPVPCNDCAYLSLGDRRENRSGSIYNDADNLRTGRRNAFVPPEEINVVDGIRCARPL